MSDTPVYRLRGEVGGLVRVFLLHPGAQQVGSTDDCEVVLPVRGVSRRHALVELGAEGVCVVDQDSRNGTFVAGAAVGRARVEVGDEVRFGPIALRLERVCGQDAVLALDFSPPPPVPGLPPSAETASLHDLLVPPAEPPDVLRFPAGYVCGRSPAATALHAQMRPLVEGDLPVLVTGETGVGKELVARALHLSSPRRQGPFVAVNCAAIPAELLESELFGHKRGAFTHAVADKTGLFEQAHGGTLLLDEIGEMPLPLQPKLLRALQQREVRPVGGAPVAVDVRVLAATNSDLMRRMEDGSFRPDLYYRTAGFVLRVPALRERREDLPLLAEAFVRVAAREAGKSIRGISRQALAALLAYAWPGNVRELEHELRRVVYLCPDGQAIESTMLSPQVAAVLVDDAPAEAEDALAAAVPPGGSLQAQVDELERRVIRETLAATGGNRSEAARRLGISRNGLALKIERLGIES